jgi:phosphatidylserine/phosphatidylglycerophosphate/cardiolipin synthase-like enzyme
MMYHLSNNKIERAFKDAAKRGGDVKIILDPESEINGCPVHF